MKINFTMDITPEEMKALCVAEVESLRIREEMRRERDLDREFEEVEARIKEAHRKVDERIAEFEKDYARISKEIEESKKAWGEL